MMNASLSVGAPQSGLPLPRQMALTAKAMDGAFLGYPKRNTTFLLLVMFVFFFCLLKVCILKPRQIHSEVKIETFDDILDVH